MIIFVRQICEEKLIVRPIIPKFVIFNQDISKNVLAWIRNSSCTKYVWQTCAKLKNEANKLKVSNVFFIIK